jgi:putative oxidoreductase
MHGSDLGLLVLRLVVGLIFAAHGAQKAFGWWNGPGYGRWQAAIAQMGFLPVPFWTAVSVAVELLGGLALAIGVLTPLAASALVGQAIVVIGKVHLPNGFWNTNRGIEFPLSLGGGALALFGTGPGLISIDHGLGLEYLTTVRVALLAIFIAGALVAVAVAHGSAVQRGQPPAAQQR